jgi:HK97 family phage prohead protease
MPWTIEDVDKHKKGLTDEEKKKWVEVANSALEKCMKDGGTEETCAISAIKQANGVTESKNLEIKKEIRIIPDEFAEVRVAKDSRTVEGRGIVFNSESRNLGGFIEKIMPEAIIGVLEKSDVLAVLNHNQDKGVLARSDRGVGSMSFSIDSRGVNYRFDAPNYDLGEELIEGIKRKDIKASSFAFTVAEENWDYKSEPAIRTIRKFDMIYDMSPCYREAYEDTTIALRNLDEVRKANEEIETKQVIAETITPPIVKPVSRKDRYLDLGNFDYKQFKK